MPKVQGGARGDKKHKARGMKQAIPAEPVLAPYGFCCEQNTELLKDRRPKTSPIEQVTLDAAGPNFRITFEEFDRAPPPPRRPPGSRSKSPINLR